MLRIQRYCTPSLIFHLIMLFVLCTPCYFFTKLCVIGGEQEESVTQRVGDCAFALFLFLVPLVVFIINYIKPLMTFHHFWKIYREKGVTDLIKKDFSNGVKYFNGQLIVGKYCMIGKKMGAIVFYDDIVLLGRVKNITVYHPSESSVEREATLRCVSGGQWYDICRLNSLFRKYSRSEYDWKRLCRVLSEERPNIAIQQHEQLLISHVDANKGDVD